MKEHTYNVPGMTLGEISMTRYAMKECLRRWWVWRSDSVWRGHIREGVAAIRKLGEFRVNIDTEVAQ